MTAWLLWLTVAAAQPAAEAPEVELIPAGHRTSFDVTLSVRPDGQLYLRDALVAPVGLEARLAEILATEPETRFVVAAEAGAPYDVVVGALDQVRAAAPGARVALEAGASGERAVDPLFPGPESATSLDEDMTDQQARELAPRRWKFPQQPYTHTDFTAYALEPGEVKLGVAWIQVGVIERFQVSTSPVADLLGVYNLQIKGNVLRTGPLDLAVTGSGSIVPVSELLQRLDLDGSLNIQGQRVQGEDLFVRSLSFFGLGVQSSLRLTPGWTAHLGAGWTRVSGRGNFDFQNLPVVVVPGLDPVGGDLTLVSSVVGELFEFRFATDIRFNRRDSLIIQAAAPLYGRARGGISGNLDGIPDAISNLDFIVSYGQALPPLAGYRASIAWQFSWQKVDLRFGLGSAAIDGTWWLQAFDLAYRFGGKTRRAEGEIRSGYRNQPGDG